MTTPGNAVIDMALCCCGWYGRIPTRTSCRACGRAFHDRVTPPRLEQLRRNALNPRAAISPAMRGRLVEMRLIAASGPPPSPSDTRAQRPPRRPYSLTETGRHVLVVSDRIAGLAGAK